MDGQSTDEDEDEDLPLEQERDTFEELIEMIR